MLVSASDGELVKFVQHQTSSFEPDGTELLSVALILLFTGMIPVCGLLSRLQKNDIVAGKADCNEVFHSIGTLPIFERLNWAVNWV